MEEFQSIDMGNNQNYDSANRSFLATSMFMFSIVAAIISVSIVLSFRQKRCLYNMVVLKESNEKLFGLLDLLAYSLKLTRPGKKGKQGKRPLYKPGMSNMKKGEPGKLKYEIG